MIVSVMTVKLYAPWIHSLKEKRMTVRSLCQKLRNKFNVSVIESKAQDLHQTIFISIAYLANNAALADSMGDRITRYIETNTDAEIVELIIEQE
ncbi:MAG: DUF503 domain-containing protein [Firmicutes bacterium]|nr:DUF503 domain-containing protein [Bacillota bacterium]NLZ38563.1 DUF503 domain-containing protein [Bacillota bacterium]